MVEEDATAIQVSVRVRPMNARERTEGQRACVSFDEPSKQVVLTAVDRSTLIQLRGSGAKGYAFDRRFGQDSTSDSIYDDCVAQLVDSCFKGYNATVMAYGQTGSGKTHTMSGGVGIHGKAEEGVTPRVIRHVFRIADQLNKKAKPGEKVQVTACALELYNEDLLDLAMRSGRDEKPGQVWDGKACGNGLKLQERPVGKDGRVVPEVLGITEVKCGTAAELRKFYDDCMENRSTSSTKLNDHSSRSHAIFTIGIHRTMVEVMDQLGEDLRARVRTQEFTSKLHLVDLAGSERVKRSGVTGKELREATHINSGLLALGNVIVALSTEAETKKKGHIPYRDSKLTRLLQDSLGGNSLTVLISCISPCEADFEETNNTLKYSNRACSIKNTPLPNKYTTLEEDLLPSIPMGGGMGLVQLQSLLEDHEKMKEMRERKDKEKREKDAKRAADLESLKEEQAKKVGYQRLRATQYDELRRQVASNGATNIPQNQVIGDDALASFGRNKLTQSMDRLPSGSTLPTPPSMRTSRAFPSRPKTGEGSSTPGRTRAQAKTKMGTGSTFGDWLASQADEQSSQGGEQDAAADLNDLILDDEPESSQFVVEDSPTQAGPEDELAGLIEDKPVVQAPALVSKSKFRRGPAAPPVREEATHTSTSRGSMDVEVESGDTVMAAFLTEDEVQELEAQGVSASVVVDSLDLSALEGEDEVELEQDQDEPLPYDPIQDDVLPKLLARFKVNTTDTLTVFKAVSKEDFKDVVGLLPENTPLPASDKMTYLLARLELGSGRDLQPALARVAAGELTMNEAVGPAVGCLMATFGTNMISSCIFEFPDPEELKYYDVDERIELWGLQIPHNSVRPQLVLVEGEQQEEPPGHAVITWTSVDRLNMSIGLLYALCIHAHDSGIKCGCCVPRPQLLKRWLQAGVQMRQIDQTQLQLIYPNTAHDYEYYKASTVAYFMIGEVQQALEKVLSLA